MKIVLFGGAFDPPHLGHQYITQSLLDHKIADEVWYVPSKDHPFSKKMTSVTHRLAMLELIVEDNPHIKIEKFELEKEGIGYSFETLEALSEKYPQHEFSWVIGSDNLAKFHLWHDGKGRDFQELLKNFRFYVYPRKGYAFEPLYENMVPLHHVHEVEVSSTDVRMAVSEGIMYSQWVVPAVKEYIEAHNLYQKKESDA